MADVAEKIEVVVEPEPPVEEKEEIVKLPERDEKGQFKAKDAAVEDLASQFKELKEKSEQSERDRVEERTRREAAEQRAAQAEQQAQRSQQEAQHARTSVVQGRVETYAQGIAAAEAEIAAAKQAQSAALEAGNWKDVADTNERLSIAGSQLVYLRELKANTEAQQQQPPEPQRPTDPIEAYVQGRTDTTANWLRSHRDFVLDQKKNVKLTAAHWLALDAGHTPDTQDYFNFVEEHIGLKQKTESKDVSPKRKSSGPVAPVANSGGGAGGHGTEVRLSAAEARAATDGTHIWNYADPSGQNRFKKGDPIGVQEMARRKLEMQKQGLYDRTYVEQ